ncbi:MerR family transcriptional regulator [Sphingobium sp. DN12]|uniref:MerR family transcriptional regulator n=1 Tax=Sphingobium sp. DN12 TaxID=3378073 RepID=UPI003DA25C30
MSSEMMIGEAAKRAGCSVPTIRYYESVGLLAEAHRTSGGHRSYRRQDVERLTLIRRCRDFGMTIDQVKTLIAIRQSPSSCDNALEAVTLHRQQLNARITELKALDRALALIIARCDSDCAGGASSCCTIYDDLSAV